MPRNISFMLTKPQIIARSKTVTRRWKWLNVKPGDILQGVEKGMGLKPGEKIKRLALIRVTDVRREPLSAITKDDCVKEGFPEMEPSDFVAFLLKNERGHTADDLITRIEFEYLEGSLI